MLINVIRCAWLGKREGARLTDGQCGHNKKTAGDPGVRNAGAYWHRGDLPAGLQQAFRDAVKAQPN